jgi:hypothetical protein
MNGSSHVDRIALLSLPTAAVVALSALWLAPGLPALLALLVASSLVGWATTVAGSRQSPTALRLSGGVEAFLLTFGFGYAFVTIVHPLGPLLGRVLYPGFPSHAESARLSLMPYRDPSEVPFWRYGNANDQKLALLIVAALVGWVVVIGVLRPRSPWWLAPAIAVDAFLVVLVGRLLVQPVTGVSKIALFEGGTYANLGLVTLAVGGGLLSLRLVNLLGADERWRTRLSVGQAWLTVATCGAALVLLGRYVHRLGLTPARLAGFGLIIGILIVALSHLLVQRHASNTPHRGQALYAGERNPRQPSRGPED